MHNSKTEYVSEQSLCLNQDKVTHRNDSCAVFTAFPIYTEMCVYVGVSQGFSLPPSLLACCDVSGLLYIESWWEIGRKQP